MAVLKTVGRQRPVGSNPTPSAYSLWGCLEWPLPCHGRDQAGSIPVGTAKYLWLNRFKALDC